jgi:hypothetical protein
MTRAGRSPVQVGRNVTDCDDGILKKNRYLIHDRDPLDTAQFLAVLGESGIESVKLPPRSPMNFLHYSRWCPIDQQFLVKLHHWLETGKPCRAEMASALDVVLEEK